MGLSSVLLREPLKCRECSKQFSSASMYAKHIVIHQLNKNFKFQCPMCIFKSTSQRGFETHFSREHKREHGEKLPDTPEVPVHLTSMACIVTGCETSLFSMKELKAHLTSHVSEGTIIACPLGLCASDNRPKNWVTTFDTASKWTKHFSRFHAKASLPANSGPSPAKQMAVSLQDSKDVSPEAGSSADVEDIAVNEPDDSGDDAQYASYDQIFH